MKQWLGIAVESFVAWPTVDTTVKFQGHKITLRPATGTTSASVEIEFEPPMTLDEASSLLRRFMSSLAWVEGASIRETFQISGGRRVGLGKSQSAMIRNPNFKADYLPESIDPKAQLALALYREALGLNSASYQFLGFFKVINIINPSGKEQCDWIKKTLPNITEHRAKQRIQELQSETNDVANYLYESGRCAVAHAYNNPIVDPDKIEDHQRLNFDLPLIKALAEYLIEHEIGVKSRRTVWREHLYELDGFRNLLGQGLVAMLKSGNKPDIAEIPALPHLSVRLRDHAPFVSLEDLVPELVEPHEGCLIVICCSKTTKLKVTITLNFSDERLIFDPTTDVAMQDDGSVAIVLAEIDRTKLIEGLIRNGQLEIWQTDPEHLLGRCDPCIPVNIDSRKTIENLRRIINELETELTKRQE